MGKEQLAHPTDGTSSYGPFQDEQTETPMPVTQQSLTAATNHVSTMVASAATSVQTPTSLSQESMFFTKLNLDVRMIIYDELYGRLPPLAHKDEIHDIPGMVLSCKQANLVSSGTQVDIHAHTDH